MKIQKYNLKLNSPLKKILGTQEIYKVNIILAIMRKIVNMINKLINNL